jgi:hypothetical protein
MTSRERMLAAIDRQPLDRLPTDIWATPEVWAALRQHFGAGTDILAALHIDAFGSTGPDYIVAPCHNLQGNAPVASILALYDEAWRYGIVEA